MTCRSEGPTNARIMIVGEAPGAEEERLGTPFVGASGRLLTDLLHKAGIVRSACFITNVCRHQPPDNDISEWSSDNKNCPKDHPNWVRLGDKWVHPHIAAGYAQLHEEIALVKPDLIIALGGTALWALTGHTGISDWRGSRLSPSHLGCTVVPTLHPAAVLRQMSDYPVLQMDLIRARCIFEGQQTPRHYQFQVAPTFDQAYGGLASLLQRAEADPIRLAGDIETRAGHIACYGVAWSPTEALCIPFMKAVHWSAEATADELLGRHWYWSVDEEVALTLLIRKLHSHPNIEWDGQNYLYDCQYYHRYLLGVPNRIFDTMIGHHSIYSTMRKGLAFLSSMYAADHVFWKDESKDWDPKLGEKQLWTYNCKDACITWEVGTEIRKEIDKQGVRQHADFQQSLFHPVLRIMNRGIRIDYDKRKRLRNELVLASIDRQDKINYMVGHPLNCKSPQQLMRFFYEDLKVPGVRHIQTDKLTTNSAALEQIANREPILLPLCQAIAELRSVGVFISTFIDAKPDVDGRMRSSFSVAGTDSYRFTSSENAFGSGLNFQNQPKEEKVKIAAAKATWIKLPNVRELFIPDPGKTFFDMDLDRADLQVVVWEADDKDLKFALRKGLDMHIFNAMAVWGFDVPIDELVEGHPNYPEHKKRYGKQRHLAKQACHATNYGVGDRKLAQTLSITVHEASRFRAKWFAAHPGIKKWHERVSAQASRGYVENRFGARLYILGRFDLPEALAWGPQSTVAGVINRALVNIDKAQQAGTCPVELLLQVHDSLAGQFPTAQKEQAIQQLRDLSRIVIPYDEPLIIPVGIGTSELSWGHC